VLLTEDDGPARMLVARALRAEGFVVAEASDLASTRAALRAARPDALVLDIVLPDGSGLELLRSLVAAGGPPVILATSRASEVDRVLGLEIGAEDYVVKPFSVRELAARIRRTVRRPPAERSRLEDGELAIDLGSREVRLGDRPIELTGREFDLLAYLVGRPRRVCSREELLRNVWGSSTSWQSPKTVTEHIRRIRRKVDHARAGRITTVTGIGYRFDPAGASGAEA
jgi:DNA-binding response OmpR family regulator